MSISAQAAGTFKLGGDLEVTRLGFGAMRITGDGIWGPPPDHDRAVAVLKRLPELGVDLIDTAESYGPYVSEELIHEALHPYENMTVATKGGLLRTGPGNWPVCGRPDFLRQGCEMSLRRLGLDEIPLYQLHRIDPDVPREEQFGVLRELQDEGKVRHVGLSEVSVEEVTAAREIVPIVSVQNLYNVSNRSAEDLVDYCDENDIGFIPWFPLGSGDLSRQDGPLADAAKTHDVSPSQIALAWLLHRSPVMLPIPGTGSVEHLEENVAAAQIELTDDEVQAITDSV